MATTKTTKTKTTKKKSTARKTKTVRAKSEASDVVMETGSAHKAGARKKDHKPCSVQGCKREYRAKGYCRTHYKQWRHGAFGKKRYTACGDYNCFRPQGLNRHGFCEPHFQDYYVKGLEQAHAPAPTKEETKTDEKAA